MEQVLLEKLIVTQLVKKFPAFLELEGSLPSSQNLATRPLLSQPNPVWTCSSRNNVVK